MKNPAIRRCFDTAIQFHVTHGDNTVQVQIRNDGAEYTHSLYLTDDDLQPLKVWRKVTMDGNTIVLLEPARLVLIETPDRCSSMGTAMDGPNESRAYIYHMDVQKFLAALRILRAKRLKFVMHLRSLKLPPYTTPLYTAQQLIRHPNARDGLSRTMLQFRKELPENQWQRFMGSISNYIDRAVFHGHDREFYFDGRRLGLGFNGGFILREKEFSIHT